MIIIFLILLLSLRTFCMEIAVQQNHTQQRMPTLKWHIYNALKDSIKSHEDSALIHIMGIGTFPLEQQCARTLACVDENGAYLKTNALGTHRVTALGGIHFKVHSSSDPLLLGDEFKVYSLMKLLFPDLEIITPTHLVLLKNVKTKLGTASYILQASRTAFGKSLQLYADECDEKRELLENNHLSEEQKESLRKELHNSLARIDKSYLSAHFFRTLLTDPRDDKGDNSMLVPEGERDLLVGIDNDHIFGRKVVMLRKTGKHVAGLKSLICCMDIFMNERVEKKILMRMKTVNGYELLGLWLDALTCQNEEFEKVVLEGFLTKSELDELGLPMKLRHGTVSLVFTNLVSIQHVLIEKNGALDAGITHQELFNAIAPLLARYYFQITRGSKTFKEAFANISSQKPTVPNSFEDILDLRKPINGETTRIALQHETVSDFDLEEPLTQTVEEARIELANRLKTHDSDPGNTELHTLISQTVSEEQTLRELEQFFQYGGHVDILDKGGNSLLDCAFKRGFDKIVSALVARGSKKYKAHRAQQWYEKTRSQPLTGGMLSHIVRTIEPHNVEFAFLRLIDEVFSREYSPGSTVCVLTTQNVKRYLHKGQCASLWKNGTFQRANKYGRRDCNYLTFNKKKLWLKHLPHLSGMAYAMCTLSKRMIGHGCTYVDFARIDDNPYLLSLGIEGTNLQKVIDRQAKIDPNKNPVCLKKLDPVSTFKSIIFAMIINPEDDKFDNFVVEKLAKDLYRLVCIDPENALVPTVGYKNGCFTRLAKSVLFCLDEMKKAIPQEVRDHFINMDPLALLQDWLGDLSTFHSLCLDKQFFYDEEIRKKFWGNKGNECFIGVPFAPGMMRRLYEKIIKIQNALKQPSVITPLDLLYEIESPLAHIYGAGFIGEKSISTRFKEIDLPLYGSQRRGLFKDNIATSTSSARDILLTQQLPNLDTIVETIHKREEIGPALSLQELNSFATTRLAKHDSTSFERFKPREKELYLQKTDFRGWPRNAQQSLFKTLVHIPWSELHLRNAAALDESFFSTLTICYLQKLTVSGCIQLSVESLQSLKLCNVLETLTMNGLKQLFIVDFLPPMLAKLKVNHCTSLTHLTAPPSLVSLEARECPALVTITPQGNLLKIIDLQGDRAFSDAALQKLLDRSPAVTHLFLNDCTLVAHIPLRHACPSYPIAFFEQFPDLQGQIMLLLNNDSALHAVHLGAQSCTDAKFEALCYALRFNMVVTHLSLSSNPITNKGIRFLKQMLEINKTLRTLDLGDIDAPYNGIPVLFETIKNRTVPLKVAVSPSASLLTAKELELAENHPILKTLSKERQKELTALIQQQKKQAGLA